MHAADCRDMAAERMGLDPVRALAVGMGLESQAVRLVECGWEPHIADTFSPGELLMIAAVLPPRMAEPVIRAAREADRV